MLGHNATICITSRAKPFSKLRARMRPFHKVVSGPHTQVSNLLLFQIRNSLLQETRPTKFASDRDWGKHNGSQKSHRVANLKLQVGQLILGASQRFTQESAGSHCRFRFSFISRYQSKWYPVKERDFNAACNLRTRTILNVASILSIVVTVIKGIHTISWQTGTFPTLPAFATAHCLHPMKPLSE